VVGHHDQRHAPGKAELLAQDLRRAGHLVEPAAVETGGFGGAQQPQALRRFLQHGARQRARQRRIVPTGQPSEDVGDVAAHAAQGGNHRLDRCPRIFRGVLVAGEALFLIVEDQARTVRLRHLDQRHAGIMRAGRTEAREIKRLAAREPVARLGDAPVGEGRAQPVKAGASHGLRRQPLRHAESRGA